MKTSARADTSKYRTNRSLVFFKYYQISFNQKVKSISLLILSYFSCKNPKNLNMKYYFAVFTNISCLALLLVPISIHKKEMAEKLSLTNTYEYSTETVFSLSKSDCKVQRGGGDAKCTRLSPPKTK